MSGDLPPIGRNNDDERQPEERKDDPEDDIRHFVTMTYQID
jgi:hypothetical protein